MICANADILHVNYEPGLFRWLGAEHIAAAKAMGKRTVMTLHTSAEGNNRHGLSAVFDRVVVHEQTTEGYTHIPEGVPVYKFSAVDGEDKGANVIGTVGFPFSWKGFHQVAIASSLLGMGCVVIAPESPHADTYAMEAVCRAAQPSIQYIKDWLSDGATIEVLHDCAVNVFAYAGGNYGISGAVRLGLAAGRPIVCTRNRQFRDLYAYENEVTFINSQDPNEIARGVQEALAKGVVPNQILKDMSWEVVGKQYQELYKSMM